MKAMSLIDFGRQSTASNTPPDSPRTKGFPEIPTWRQTLLEPAKEFSLTDLQVISGAIPTDLHGSLYKNGPGRVQRGANFTKHWFDGDGAILAVHFKDGQAKATYKYIQSPCYKEEEAQNKLIYAGFGSTMNVPFYKRPIIQKFKNPGNISVLPLPDRLLALWEADMPYSLDPYTLETHGIDNLGNLSMFESFSAHPKVDPETQEIFNFGIKKGYPIQLSVYKYDKAGKLLMKNNTPMRFNAIHDCVMAGPYLIIMNFATKFSSLASLILGFKPIKDLLKPAPELGTEVYIFRKDDLSLVSQFKTDPYYAYHFANGYEQEDGSLYIEFVRHDGFEDFHKYASSITDLSKPLPVVPNTHLSYMKIDPIQGKVLESGTLSEIGAEYPIVADNKVGKKWRYTYFNSDSSLNKHAVDSAPGSVGRYDYETGKVELYEYGMDKYVSEANLVTYDKETEDSYILTLVYDAAEHKSEVWIQDTKNFSGEPVCKLALPEVVPLGFHGKWQDRSSERK